MINSAKLLRFESGKIRAPAMGPLHCLCRLVVLLSLSMIRGTVTSPNDQCQFIFKEDSVLQVALSQDDGAKVTMDLHAENKFKCAEACCESEGEWCTLAVFHTKTGPEAMNCFLVQCIPDGSENNVCVTKHVRRSGFISATVQHLTDQKPRLLDHLLYSKVDANHRVRRSLYPDLLEENLSRNKIRSHIRPVSSSSMSDSSVSESPVAPRSSSRSIASSSSISVPQQSSPVSSSVSTPSSSPSSPPSSSSSVTSSSSTSASVSSSPSRSASQSLSLSSSSSSSTSSSLMPPSISPSSSSFMSSRSSKVQSHSISKTTVTSSFPFSNHGISSKEETISSSSAPSSSNTATLPTTPAPVTTPSIPPPPPSSPDTPSVSVNTSAPPLAPISPPTSPLNSSSDAFSNAATSSSDVISANNSVEALNNLNAVINSSLTSPSSNPATTNVKPSPTTVAATDIPTQKQPKVQTTAKPTKATTKPTTKAGIVDTTPTPKWTSPVSLTASQMSDSNATQPINATQSGQDGTESPGEVKHDNINRATVTQTGILIVTLCFGIIFLLAMMVVVGKRWCEGYQRRKYSKVDYLINGYYS